MTQLNSDLVGFASRTSAGGKLSRALAGDGSVDTDSVALGLSQSSTLVAVLAIHLGSDAMSVHYSTDGGASFATIPDVAGEVAALSPDRAISRVRMVLNNDLSQDNVLLDRLYLTDANPFPGLIPDAVPEPSASALLILGMTSVGLLRRR